MADSLSKPEQSGLRASDVTAEQDKATHANFFQEFANATVYSALEQPALGLAQFFGTDASKKVTKVFDTFGIHGPTEDKSLSGWTANTLGGAVGMLLPFALTKGALNKAGVFGEAEVGLLSNRSLLGMSLKESAYTGFAYGAILTPSKETDNAGTLLTDRFLGGVGSAATFTTLTAGSFGLGRLAETSIAGRIGADVALRNPILAGTLSGLPAGIVSSEYDSLTKGGRFATASELGQSMAGMALVGGVFGAKAKFEPQINAGSTYIADALRSKFNVPKFETSTQYPGGTGRDITDPLPIINDGSTERVKSAEPVKDAAPKPPPVELLPEEQAIAAQIIGVKTAAEWRQLSEHIKENGRPETDTWFNDQMESKAATLSNAELETLWPQIIVNDPAQAYRIAKDAGAARTEELWQSQLKSVQQNPDAQLANGLGRLLVILEPSKQLGALDQLLKLDQPPASVTLAPTTLDPANQLAAAKMLVRDGITPYLTGISGKVTDWANWIFSEPPGQMREQLITQLNKQVGNSSKTTQSKAAEVNEVLKTAQEKAAPSEIEALRGMLHAADSRNQTAESAEIRKTVLDGLDPKFVGRLFFHEHNWDASDRIAQTHPDLIKALAENTRLNGEIPRNDYLASLMSGEPPITASQLAQSLSQLAQTAKEKGLVYPLKYGDLQALAEHGVKPAPHEVAPLLRQLRDDALQTFGMDSKAEQNISTARLLSDMTLAKEFSKNNPELFETEFQTPIERALSDPNLSYDRRLEAARALGELQRQGFDSAQSIHMPDLRMGKFAELTPQEQAHMRESSEAALRDRASMEAMIGDGPLGRLMPTVFGFASEGGIVGRKQHQVHDNTVDTHLLDVMEKAGKDPRFNHLLPQDQTNALWASFLHDVSKRENMVDLDHGWTSTSTAWGVLRTLGYPESQIQRITDIMGRDFDLSFDPDHKNSVRFQDQNALDDVITAYRAPGALDMVSILNASDIQSVKADGSWYTPEVIAELETIRSMGQERVDYLNKNLLPVMTTEMPKGFGAHELSDYNVMAHSSPDLTGQLLRHRSTVESPQFSMSVSLLTPDHRNTYTDFRNVNATESQVVALVDGPFEHIAQAHRGNLSTGKSVGWDGHVELVRRWASDHRAERLSQEAEAKLAELNIPPDPKVAAENNPRLAQLRRILSQFNNLDDLTRAAGRDNQYVVAAHEVNRLLTTERDGTPLKTHNEIKINNPIVTSIGLLRKPNQTIYFEGVPESALYDLWQGNVPDYVRTGEPGRAPQGALVITNELMKSAKDNNLPFVVLNPRE